MGCDIHAHIEIKSIDDKWHKADPFLPNLINGKPVKNSELPLGRNYELFSILEVNHERNYNNAESIAPARGIPKDSAYYQSDDFDGPHSDYYGDLWGESYLSFAEIINFAEKHPTLHMQGYVEKEDYEKLQKDEITCPDFWWLSGSKDMLQYHAEWTMPSPIVKLANQLDFIAEMYRTYCFENDEQPDLSDKAKHQLDKCALNIYERMRLIFAFDN